MDENKENGVTPIAGAQENKVKKQKKALTPIEEKRLDERRKKVSKAIDIILGAIIAFMLFVMGSMIVSMQTSPYGVPSVFGKSFLYVATDSMAIDTEANEEQCSALVSDSEKDECYRVMAAENADDYEIGHFSAGSGVIIEKTEAKTIKVGDVITFYYDKLGALDTHRVKAIVEPGETILYKAIGSNKSAITVKNSSSSERMFLTRGDNLHAQLSAGFWAPEYYETVLESKVVGKVTFASEGFGTFLSFVSPAVPGGHATWVYPLFVLLPLLFIAVSSIIDTVKAAKSEAKEEQEEIDKAIAEAGIDPNEEKAVYLFTAKLSYKIEMKKEMEKEKERLKKALRKQMRKQIEQEKKAGVKVEDSAKPREKTKAQLERERLKEEMRAEILKERAEAKAKAEAEAKANQLVEAETPQEGESK